MRHTLFFLLLLTVPATACTWETELPGSSIAVDPARELVITDEATLDALSNSADDGPLSFRYAARHAGFDVARWLDAWSARRREEGGSGAFDEQVVCPWLRRDPDNACDETCRSCEARHVSLATAPFRLIAVANRTDLSDMPDRAAAGGEARLVFALESDEGAARPLTVIFEYAQEGSAREWTERWHALGAAPDLGAALTTLTRPFVDGGTIAQVRTADALAGRGVVLHQFALQQGELVPAPVRNTPDFAHVDHAAVRRFADAHQDEIARGTALMPRAWWSGHSTLAPEPAWLTAIPEHDLLFRQTCGGCHATSGTGFHVDPLASGRARLSSFVVDTELPRRTTWMQATLASP